MDPPGVGDDEPPGEESGGDDSPDDRFPDDRSPDSHVPTENSSDDPPVGPLDPGGGVTDRSPTAENEPREESRNEERTGWVAFAHDVVSSVLAVVIVGVLLFAVSGVWPPMVAVESPSMTPNMQTGDLVFVMDEQRFPGEGAHEGVVTARTGGEVEYRKFDRPGDVIVYTPDGNTGQTPIIHRAMFWVEEGENWYEKADRQSVGRYSECGETTDEALPNCPAPHDGFITKGDANGVYDQAQGSTGLSTPVRPAWVVGTAELRVPRLGCIRLRTEGCLSLFAPSVVTASQAEGPVPASDDANASSPDSAVSPGTGEDNGTVIRQGA